MFTDIYDEHRGISAMFLQITHGYSIERAIPDPLVALIEKAAQEFYIAAAPGAWLVDIFPWRTLFDHYASNAT